MSNPAITGDEVATPATLSKKAAVIDDAFDAVMPGEISVDDFRIFEQLANEEGELDRILEELSIDLHDFSEWTNESQDFLIFLNRLWQNREHVELSKLLKVSNLFSKKLEKLSALDQICRNLEQNNIKVEKFTSNISDLTSFEQGEFLYIFIDYRLGVDDGDTAIENAKSVIRNIYEKCRQGKQRPVTILMSAKSVTQGDKEKFQEGGGFIEGVFRFSAKDDLINPHTVSLLIRAYKEEFHSNHVLQDYIESLNKAAEKAQQRFQEEIKVLRIEDYEFLHDSVLQEQKQPLGDYLAWLYGSLWTNLLLQDTNLQESQKKIDSVISEKPPLHHDVPSDKIAEIFMTALFEQNLDEITGHPMTASDSNGLTLPYLHLGDILTKAASNKVFMIINPQCDLERPEASKVDQSIFVIPGALDPIENIPPKNAAKTEFFIFENRKCRILWQMKNVLSIPYSGFDQWKTSIGLERKYRLRLPFALDIQQKFTSSMSRVGLPVSPPFSRNFDLKVQFKKPDKSIIELLPKSSDYAFVPITGSNKEIRLTLKFALDFKAALIHQHGKLEETLAIAYPDGKRPSADSKLKADLGKFISEFDEWFFKLQNRAFPFPTETPKPLNNDKNVSVILNGGEFTARTSILINVITKPEVQVAEAIPDTSSTLDAQEDTDALPKEYEKKDDKPLTGEVEKTKEQ